MRKLFLFSILSLAGFSVAAQQQPSPPPQKDKQAAPAAKQEGDARQGNAESNYERRIRTEGAAGGTKPVPERERKGVGAGASDMDKDKDKKKSKKSAKKSKAKAKDKDKSAKAAGGSSAAGGASASRTPDRPGVESSPAQTSGTPGHANQGSVHNDETRK
jgi:hypothetical protein